MIMNKIILLSICLLSVLQVFAQHGFPKGHWCNEAGGWATKRCRALAGLKNEEKNKVITIPHRGVWGKPGIPESSLKSVIEAYNKNYMFVEIDIIMTKDRELALCHDQQTNRMTSLPKTFSADGNLFDNGTFFRSLNWNKSTPNSVYDSTGTIINSFPPLKDAYYIDRLGNVTTQKLNRLQDIFAWCHEKEIILALDIKTGSLSDPVVKLEYLETIKLCLELAKKTGTLHQIIFKPGSAGQVTVDELKNYLNPLELWDAFSTKISVVLINIVGGSFPMATNKEYLDKWMSLPSLIGIEHIYKNSDDQLLTPKSEFGNKSIVQYTKEKGFRTGVFHPIPTDERGAPGGRGNYFNPKNHGVIDDLRGSLEFLFGVPDNVFPGMLVTDRPDSDMNFLELFGLNSKYTKRTGSY